MSKSKVLLVITVGRLALVSLFFLGGINKLINYGATLEAMSRVGLPIAEAILPIVIFLELAGAIAVAVGGRLSVIAASTLALFTVATNFVFHDFWNMTDQRATLELSLFFKNIAIAGALASCAGVSIREQNDPSC